MSTSPLRLMVLETLQHAANCTGGKVRFDVFARNSLTHPKAWDDFQRHVDKGEILSCDGLVWLPEHQNMPPLASEATWNELVKRWTATPIPVTVSGFFHRAAPGRAMDPRIVLIAFGRYAGLNKVEVCHAVAEEIAIDPKQTVTDPLTAVNLSLTKLFGMSVADINTDYQSIVNFAVQNYRAARKKVIEQSLADIGQQREKLCNELETLK